MKDPKSSRILEYWMENADLFTYQQSELETRVLTELGDFIRTIRRKLRYDRHQLSEKIQIELGLIIMVENGCGTQEVATQVFADLLKLPEVQELPEVKKLLVAIKRNSQNSTPLS